MIRRFIIIAAFVTAVSPVYAAVYDLPPEGHDVIGAISSVVASYDDTLVDIARRHGLGYQDIVRANPNVNVWVPGEGLAGVLVAGLVVYGLALQAFGPSWRFTIDREHAGELMTGGIFARTRNPIYLGLSLLAFGSSLLLGRPILLVLTLVFVVYFAHLIRREEAFLRAHYGEPYRAYCHRVGRVWTFRARPPGVSRCSFSA